MQKILFAASEVYPLIKTGGLADVAASLPRALLKLGQDVKILMPAYASVLEKNAAPGVKEISRLTIDGQVVSLKQTRLSGTRVAVLLVDIPEFSQRKGNPYCGPDGHDWHDNHKRFYLFARVAEQIALNQANLDWQPDIVHCNDWQTGLIPALLSLHPQHPATVFTIHNLAYQGLFSHHAFTELNLPSALWHHERLEFWGQMSFIKGGLAFADYITTVSPSYAKEIQQPEFGFGLDGVMRYRCDSLVGILNGIDTDEWNPGTDPHIAVNYNRRTLGNKVKNKLALQQALGLEENPRIPLFGFIGRLVEQKGVDLILAQIDRMLTQDCQLVILGSGMPRYETELKSISQQYPQKVALTIGYSEVLAHQIEASCDIFLMPSIFEPCGLNQMYSLRYGTLPIVNAVGGLRDTVFESALDEGEISGNGFVLTEACADNLFNAIQRAISAYQQPDRWKKMQLNAMERNFSWDVSAKEYLAIYQRLFPQF
jgi:starch synthase